VGDLVLGRQARHVARNEGQVGVGAGLRFVGDDQHVRLPAQCRRDALAQLAAPRRPTAGCAGRPAHSGVAPESRTITFHFSYSLR
jgi:hypothetical protein